jgi:hypothetical protein
MSPNVEDVGLDDPLLLDTEAQAAVIRSVLSLGRWAMLVPKDGVIDGADQRVIPTYKTLGDAGRIQGASPQDQTQAAEQ